jgi:uncharacterized protein YbaP (TraB family)
MRLPIIVVFFSRIFFSLLLLAFGPAAATERGALYKVTANGHTLHLFGTIHLGRPDFYPLEPRLRAAMAAAPTLALEVDLERDPAAVTAAVRQHGMFAAGSPGYAGLAPARRARIEGALRKLGLEPAGVVQLKPWVLGTMLAVVEATKLGYQIELGIDKHLAQLARAGSTKVAELESVQFQAALFNRMPVEQQWRMLEETLEMIESGRAARETRELVDAYNRADHAALEAILTRLDTDPSQTAKFTRELLLDGRNGPMADKLVEMLKRENNAVAAVGVLHLVGKRGLPELLRARGMTVERVY